jgi:hypothetical protein
MFLPPLGHRNRNQRRSQVSRESLKKIHARIPPDVVQALDAWADHNVSSVTAEIVRSVRVRVEQEQREKVAG